MFKNFGLALALLLLLTGHAEAAITFVGSATNTQTNGADPTVTFPGGVSAGDVALTANCIGGTTDVDFYMSVISPGWTAIADVFGHDVLEAHLGVFRRVMGSTPDSTVTWYGHSQGNSGVAAAVYILSGVDNDTPEDATTTTASDINGPTPDPASITTSTNGAWVMAFGCSSEPDTPTAPSGYSNLAQAQVVDTGPANIMVASKEVTSAGAENPGTFGGIAGDSNDAWASATVAMRVADGTSVSAKAEFETGYFAASNAAGNQTVNIAHSWTPKAVLLFGAKFSAPHNVTFLQQDFLGGFSSSSDQFAMDYVDEEAVGTMDNRRSFQSDQVLSISSQTTDAISIEANAVSLGAGQFTINWTNATTDTIGYMAFGGSELSAAVRTWDITTSTGNQSFTGLSFQPSAAILFSTIDSTTEGVAAGAYMSIGVCVSTTKRWAMAWSSEDNLADSNTNRYLTDDYCLVRIDGSATVLTADFVSFNSDGMTINVTDAPAATTRIGVLFLGGSIGADAAIITAGAATGNESETVSFTPDALFSAGYVDASLDTMTAGVVMGISTASANPAPVPRQWLISGAADDAAATSNTARYHSFAYTFGRPNTSGFSIANNGQIQSFGSSGWTTNWETSDAASHQWGVLALHYEAPAGGSIAQGVIIGQ